MKVPCFKCPERTLGCHAECDRYKKFQAKREQFYAKKHQANLASSYFTETKAAYAIHRDKNKHYTMSVN